MECSFQVVTFLACISNMITIGSDIEQPEKNPKKVEQNNIIHICPTHFLYQHIKKTIKLFANLIRAPNVRIVHSFHI
ncbi:hypothetical protein Hanom_Chr08g00742271 [Helianthus anomalus]